MKKLYLILIALLPVFTSAQVYTGQEAQDYLEGTTEIRISNRYAAPDYIKFAPGNEIPVHDFELWAFKALKFDEGYSFKEINKHEDNLGYVHIRLQLNYHNIPVTGAVLILHVKNQMIESVNGCFPPELHIANSYSITDEQALNRALNFVDAESYKWELPQEEAFIRQYTGNPDASFYPEAEKAIVPVNIHGEYAYAFAWKFNIYAHTPVYRADIYVDATNGEILLENKKIHHIDSPGSANTKYSGTRNIVTDYTGTQFRLRETGRGNGIETYDLNNSTSYSSAVDFTDTDNYWNNYNTQLDEVATDAHWAAEVTYDYFYTKHNRNSIDDNGLILTSYIHYDHNYANAFWNGQFMTFGDGNGSSISPLTTLDIVGHEITHGLTSYTANLIYQDESGALNEGFSDIFGAAIEKFGRPSNHNWMIGEDIGLTLRSMANPNAYQLPDTYYGNFWYTGTNDNGGVHTNMGVFSYWFYLCVEGGSGTNDNNDNYQVTPIGMDSAAAIAYRMLNTYLTPGSEYDDARFYAIRAATDLYGPCSKAVETVTDAMHATGVGNAYIPGVQADFSSGISTFCQPPATVKFSNHSNNATSYYWDFGDGNFSTDINPVHTYTQYGDFTVQLIADGGSCGTDTLIDSTHISINPNNPCHTITPQSGNLTITNCNGFLYDDGGPGANYSNNSGSYVTIAPPGASSITLTFTSFHFESGYDYLKIYEGSGTSGNLIGSYDGNSLPNGGTIVSNTGAVTIQQVTDQYATEEGFELQWSCTYPNMPPTANFTVSDTFSCDGLVYFDDLSNNGPTSWLWDFGDGNSSTVQNPAHQYAQDGTYNIRLKVSNSFGVDSVMMQALIKVRMPDALNDDTSLFCFDDNFALYAAGNGTTYWYADAQLSQLLDTGNTYYPSAVSADTAFYATNRIIRKPLSAGKTDNTGGGGFFTSPYEHYLVFDVYQPLRLKSVKVYAGSAGYRQIILRSSNGTVLYSENIFIPQGESRIDLDFNIPTGTNYELSGPQSPDLYRNSNGITYPYKVDNLISVNYSSASTDPTGYYYYFYDWEVVPSSCSSPAARYDMLVFNSKPSADFTQQVNNSQVIFTNNTIQADSYYWDFGDGNTSVKAGPVHYYPDTGTYQVTLIAANPCGTDTFSSTIAIETTGIEDFTQSNIRIYPNPAEEHIFIEINNPKTDAVIRLYDMNGKRIMREKEIRTNIEAYKLSLTGLSAGIYVLKILSGDEVLRRKIIVI